MLNSALTVTPKPILNWGQPSPSGTLTSLTDPDALFDWTLYANRDKELAYRDLQIATNVTVISVELGTIWNADFPRPIISTTVDGDLETRWAGYVSAKGTLVHLSNLAVPADEIDVDRQLYARDIVLQETLARSTQILVNPPFPVLDSSSNGTLIAGGTIMDAWSLGSAVETDETINPALPLNADLFRNPDKNLASRDNQLAYYTAALEQALANPFEVATRLLVQVSGTHTAEPEIYSLADETISSRVFQAEPVLPGRMKINYDRQLHTLQWFSEDPLTIHVPQPQPYVLGGINVAGPLPGQQLTVVPKIPDRLDAQFWRQKAARVLFASKSDVTVFSSTSPADLVVNNVMASFGDAVMMRPGTSRLALSGLTLNPGQHRVSLLFAPTPRLTVPGAARFSGGTVNGNFVDFSTSGGTVQWQFALAAGNWTMKVSYTNVSGLAPAEFPILVGLTGSVSRNIGLRFAVDGNANGDVATFLIPIVATGGNQVLTIQWTGDTTSQLEIQRFDITSEETTNPELDLSASLIGPTGPFAGPATMTSLVGRRYRDDVISFNFTTTSAVANPSLDLTWATDTDESVALVFKAVQVTDVIGVTKTVNAAGFESLRSECLQRALKGISDSYLQAIQNSSTTPEFRVSENGQLLWTDVSSTAWINLIQILETRLLSAFRKPLPWDVGRPALVPLGLEVIYDGENAGQVKGNYDATLSVPTIQPLQPWMMNVGILVAHEDFWDADSISFV